jgi:thioesterase domain-containing protein
VIAYEMARQLAGQGDEVALLALLDASLANSGAPEAEDADARRLGSFMRHLGLAPDALTIAMRDLLRLGEEEQLATVLEQARRTHLFRPDVEPAELPRRMQIFVSHLRAIHGYMPQPYPGRLVLIDAEESAGTVACEAVARWEALARGGFSRYVVPGDHYTMLREPHVTRLAEELARLLRVVDAMA